MQLSYYFVFYAFVQTIFEFLPLPLVHFCGAKRVAV
jgi:hypothetical protein